MPNLLSCGIILVCLASFAGCSQPESPEPASTTDDSSTSQVADRDGEPVPPAREPTPATPADDPALALKELAETVAAGDSKRLSAALSDTTRQRLDAWWNASVLAVDPAIRGDVAAAIAQFSEALLAQRTFVLATDRIEFEGAAASVVRRRFDAVLHAVIELAAWPGWTSTDEDTGIGPLIDRLASIIADRPALQEELRGLAFETVSRDGGNAVVRITTIDGSSPVELAVSKMGASWQPTALGRLSPSDSPETAVDPAARAAALRSFATGLREVTSVLSSIESQGEFDAQVDRAAQLVMASAGRAIAAPRAVAQSELVTVHVLGDFDATEKDRLLWKVVSQTDTPAGGQGESIDRPAGDGVSITAGPVADVATFADRLTGLTIEAVDVDGRTITARRREP